MPEVISNTTPIQYLHQIGCLEERETTGTITNRRDSVHLRG